jgi:hypothetical protein
MSRKLHLATSDRDTERGLSNSPGTGTPRQGVTAPNVSRKTNSGQQGVHDLEEEERTETPKTLTAKPGK